MSDMYGPTPTRATMFCRVVELREVEERAGICIRHCDAVVDGTGDVIKNIPVSNLLIPDPRNQVIQLIVRIVDEYELAFRGKEIKK